MSRLYTDDSSSTYSQQSSAYTSEASHARFENEPILASQYHVKLLQQAWLSERASPIVLPFNTTLFSSISLLLEASQEELDKMQDSCHSSFEMNVKQMFFDRIKFTLASYLRTRLSKIEKQITYFFPPIIAFFKQLENQQQQLNPDQTRALAQAQHESSTRLLLLSPHEREFARDFSQILHTHFSKSFIHYTPTEVYVRRPDPAMTYHPNLKDCVLAQANDDIHLPVLDEFLLSKDTVFIIPFEFIETHVVEGTVNLL